MEERLAKITELEEVFGHPIITYITSDRKGLSTQLAADSVKLIYRHLEEIGKQDKIGLYLYTPGGNLMAPIRLVHLLREYCDILSVIVPHRALSAGSLLCLGADEIYMGKLSELSPVDPSTANAFNPQDPHNPQRRIPISVEDLRAYFSLAQETAGLKSEDSILSVFSSLSAQISPIALGNVYRVYSEIRLLVKNLLSEHMIEEDEKLRVPEIVTALTEIYTHDFLICRSEAEKIGLKVKRPSSKLDKKINKLFIEYEKALELQEPFNPDGMMKDVDILNFKYETAYIESLKRSDTFLQEGIMKKQDETPAPPSTIPGIHLPSIRPVMITFTNRKWVQLR